MSTLATLVVKIVGDAGDFREQMEGAANETKSFGDRVQQAGQIALGVASGALVALGAAVAAIGPQAITAASDLSESMSKANVVFGDSTRVVKEFAETSDWAFGIAKGAAYESAATFGNLFVTMGMGRDSAADMSVNIVRLAADLASFNNLNTADVLEKLRSGLIGEAEPMRSLGVLLTEEAVKAKALSMGLTRTAIDTVAVAKAQSYYNERLSMADDVLKMYGPNSREHNQMLEAAEKAQKKLNAAMSGATLPLTEAAKVQARYAIIMEQSKTAQGDFARTSDGLANTQRILGAVWKNLITDVGTTFLPVVLEMARNLGALAKRVLPGIQSALKKLGPVVQDIANSIGIFIEALFRTGDPLEALSGFMDNFPTIKPTVDGMIASLRGFIEQINNVILAVTPYVNQAMQWISQNIEIKDVLIALGAAIAAMVVPAILSLVAGVAPIIAAFAALVAIVTVVRRAWEENWLGIRDTLTAAWTGTIQPALAQLWAWLQVNVPAAIRTLAEFWTNTLQPALMQVWNFIQMSVIPILAQLWAWLATNVPAAVQALSEFFNTTLLPALRSIWAFLSEHIIPLFQAVAELVAVVVVKAIEGWWLILTQQLFPALQSIWNLIQVNLIPVFNAVVDVIRKNLGPAFEWARENILRPFIDALVFIIGYIDEIRRKIGGLTSALSNVHLPGEGGGEGRAGGGPVQGGRPYLVGERGPEIFVPGMSGTIIPNSNVTTEQNNFNLTIYSSAPVENLIQDFAMMQAMAG